MESRGTDLCILNLSNRWRWVVNFTPLAALPLGEEFPVPTGQEFWWPSLDMVVNPFLHWNYIQVTQPVA